MRQALCWLGWHRWEFFGRMRLAGRWYVRYDHCAHCRAARVRGEEKL